MSSRKHRRERRVRDAKQRGYVSGQWRALNDVLNYLNTLDVQQVSKKEIYRAVFDMRPSPH